MLAVVAGGVGIPLYAVGWLLIPADGPEKPVFARLLTRRDTWLVAAGMGCLTLAGVLLLRTWGVWFLSDKIVWPLVIAAAGGALIWRQSQAAPGRARPQPRGGAAARRRSTGSASAWRWCSARR